MIKMLKVMERPFDEEEVKTICNFCSFRSTCHDGVIFGFIKDFWLDIKGDFMRLMPKFYVFEKLVKDSYYW
jgi:hypothetical protein